MICDGAGSVTGWYCVSMGRYWLVLCGTGSVSSGTGLVKGSYACIYRKKMEIWLDVTIAGRTDKRTRKDRATQPMDHGRLR